MFKNSMFFIGLDLGDKHSHLIILDQDGEVIEETRLPTPRASFQRRFSTLSPSREAMEVGAHSRWAGHLIKEPGHDVLVANARKLRAIYRNPGKGHRADAETLSCELRKRETPTCADCSSGPHSTSSGLLDPMAICAAGA